MSGDDGIGGEGVGVRVVAAGHTVFGEIVAGCSPPTQLAHMGPAPEVVVMIAK